MDKNVMSFCVKKQRTLEWKILSHLQRDKINNMETLEDFCKSKLSDATNEVKGIIDGIRITDDGTYFQINREATFNELQQKQKNQLLLRLLETKTAIIYHIVTIKKIRKLIVTNDMDTDLCYELLAELIQNMILLVEAD